MVWKELNKSGLYTNDLMIVVMHNLILDSNSQLKGIILKLFNLKKLYVSRL